MKTGVFWNADKSSVLVYWCGKVIATYPDMEAFVESHAAYVEALETSERGLIEREYLP